MQCNNARPLCPQ